MEQQTMLDETALRQLFHQVRFRVPITDSGMQLLRNIIAAMGIYVDEKVHTKFPVDYLRNMARRFVDDLVNEAYSQYVPEIDDEYILDEIFKGGFQDYQQFLSGPV